jgi:hypothetical protein
VRRTTTHARGSHVRGSFLNALQDEQVGLVPGAQNPAGAVALRGFDGRYVVTPDAGVAHNTLAVLDDSIDWRGRLLRGAFVRLETPAQRLHGADAWQANDPTRPVAVRLFEGRTGTGGLGAASAAVANGTPPVIASGSFAVVVDEGAYTVELLVTAARSDLSAACGWKLYVTVVNTAGAVSLVSGGALIVGPTDGATTWAVTVDVSGTALRLRVTGAAATTIDWTARWIVG